MSGKQTGLGWTTLSVDDSSGTPRDIRNDLTNFQFATPRAVQDATGVDKSAMERLLLLADMSMSLTGVVNVDANKSHATLKTVPSTSVLRTVTLTASGVTLASEMLGTDYSITRTQSGELTFAAPFVLADGTVPTWA